MEKIPTAILAGLRRIICFFFGHDYLITQKITDHISEYRCSCCGKEVSNSYSGQFEDLTYKRKEVNECLSHFFQKKNRVLLP